MNCGKDHGCHWWTYVAGILLIALGGLAIILPNASTLGMEIVIGWLFLIGGIAYFIHAIQEKSESGFIWKLLGAIVYFAAGILLIRYPLQGELTLTMVLAALFTVEGVFKIIGSIQMKPQKNWAWIFVSGIISIILGIIIWADLPGSATWAIGLIIGINMVFAGWAILMLPGFMKKIEA